MYWYKLLITLFRYSKTTKVGAVLSDLSPGTWYQFRLKAASGAGFGGNGRPSRPVKLMTLPDAPRNLTESNLRIYSNKVEVKLQWEPPAHGSVPVKFYRVRFHKSKIRKHIPYSRFGCFGRNIINNSIYLSYLNFSIL